MGNDNTIDTYNPGSIDISKQNPTAYGNITALQGYQNKFNDYASTYTDPNRYQTMLNNSNAASNTSIANQMANVGLAGSSAMFGNQANAMRQNGLANQQQQFNDYQSILKDNASLTGQENSIAMGAQNQYGQYQNGIVQAQQQADASQNQAIGSALQAGAGIASMAIAPNPFSAMALANSMGGMSGGGGGSSYGSMNGYGAGGSSDYMGMAGMNSYGNDYGGYASPNMFGYGGQ